MEKFSTESLKKFYNAILALKTEEECHKFFEDVCTIKELQDISQRIDVADLLNKGGSYQEVSKATGASTATICRVNKCLVYGGGGYKTVLDRIEKEDK